MKVGSGGEQSGGRKRGEKLIKIQVRERVCVARTVCSRKHCAAGAHSDRRPCTSLVRTTAPSTQSAHWRARLCGRLGAALSLAASHLGRPAHIQTRHTSGETQTSTTSAARDRPPQRQTRAERTSLETEHTQSWTHKECASEGRPTFGLAASEQQVASG